MYWQTKKACYLRLSLVAWYMLLIAATSVSSEELFSTAGQVVTSQRTSLNGQATQQLVILQQDLTPDISRLITALDYRAARADYVKARKDRMAAALDGSQPSVTAERRATQPSDGGEQALDRVQLTDSDKALIFADDVQDPDLQCDDDGLGMLPIDIHTWEDFAQQLTY